jgi:hypothetical protein
LDNIFVPLPEVEQLEAELTQREETIRTLEQRLEEINSTQARANLDTESVKRQVENSERIQSENQSLRFANDQFKIEYDKLVEELKDRENDEERYMLQVS